MKLSEEKSNTNECAICMNNIINTVFYPCGHNCTCYECSIRFITKPCPICRQKVFEVMKIYS